MVTSHFALMPDHPAYAEAVDALRRYHEARPAGTSEAEVERLRAIAEALFQAATDYQFRALGHSDERWH